MVVSWTLIVGAFFSSLFALAMLSLVLNVEFGLFCLAMGALVWVARRGRSARHASGFLAQRWGLLLVVALVGQAIVRPWLTLF